MKSKIAPSPAPAEMPSSPGSARLFLSIDCNTIPEQDKEEPTSMEFKTLGNLISNKTFFLTSFSEENIFINSLNETATLPSVKDIINDKIKRINKTDSIKNFLDNN